MKSSSYLFILVVCLLYGCTRHNDIAGCLQQAEDLIWTYPDSAQSLLETIPYPEKLQGKEQADYALWLSLSKYRNNIQANSDSLINIAIEYYKDKDNPNRIGTAWYTKAGILEELFDSKEQAVLAYKEAESFIPEMTDFKAISRIYSSLAYWNKKNLNYNKACEYYNKSILINKANNNTTSLANNLMNLIVVYWALDLPDSTEMCINYLDKLVPTLTDSSLCSKIYHNIGLQKYYQKELNKAELYYLKALEYGKATPSYKTLSNLAQLYTETNRHNQADSLFNMALNTTDLATKAILYKRLYKKALSEQRYQKADSLINEYITINDAYYKKWQTQNIEEIQAKYDHFAMYRKKLEMKNRWLLTTIIALVISGVLFSFLYVLREKNRKITLKLGKLLQEITLQDDQYQILLTEMEDLVTQKQKIEKLMNQYRLIYGYLETVTKEDILFWQSIHHLIEGNNYQPEKDKEYLIRFLNMFKNGFADKLHTAYPMLQKRMLDVCYLAAFGFSIERIAESLNVEVRTIERYMFNICQDTNFPQKGKKGFIAFINSIS